MATQAIGQLTILFALKKERGGRSVESDKIGKSGHVFKYTSNDKDRALEHIRSFPHVPSHYTRKNSQRQYLEHRLNITKMYELYQEWCKSGSQTAVSQTLYRQIFNTKENLDTKFPYFLFGTCMSKIRNTEICLYISLNW